MFKFLHGADIHLDSPMHRLDRYEGAPVERLRHATRRAFGNLVELAIEEKVAFVLIAGDLYDGDWHDYNTGLYLVSQLSRLREAHIPVYIVAGNHDAASKITKTLRLPEGVILFASDKPETHFLEHEMVALHGQSFPSPAVTRNLSKDYPSPVAAYFNIGLLHTCATGREGHEPYAPCTLDDLRSKGYDYWALGHVHEREVLLEHPLTVFPGNVQGRHVRESGAKGCVLVNVDDQGTPQCEFRSLDVVRWCREKFDAYALRSGYDLVDRAAERMETLLKENPGLTLILRVQATGGCPAHDELASDVERWTNEMRAAALDQGGERLWIEKVEVLTRPISQDGTMEEASGPMAELMRDLREICNSPEAMQNLGSELDDLRKKLPRELAAGGEGAGVDDEAWLSRVLAQVKPMLIRRLIEKEEKK
jgi:exonuclease SbcD